MKSLSKFFSKKNVTPRASEELSNGDLSNSTEREFGSGSSEDAGNESGGRRKFLLRCSKYAAFTAPVIYTLLAPKGSIYAASGGS